ncbi:phosphoethanolamine transferase [Herbaspirillum sp. B65]|jgi:heptose-I-phosphate ethanolaminephosphotransferase|uniref:phosphoethanolamine transferase n=1 Tax=Herbaspirillum sp. B65 TaxID=137708 RepID=UPI00034DBF96|nr:phosphoethanolamine transferase [Herbaspirillum sp. B65]
MNKLVNRLVLGLIGLAIFWALGRISANELAKSSVLMATALPGIAGLCLVLPWLRARPRWFSAASVGILGLFFLDAAIKGFLRDYFGLRPNPILVLQAIFNTNPAESSEFFRHNGRDLAEALGLLWLMWGGLWLGERWLRRRESGRVPAPWRWRGRAVVGSLLAVFVALHFNPTMAKENPLLFWPIRYLDYRAQMAQAASMEANVARNMAHRSDWQVSYHGPERNTLVWVIGESLNRANMSLYGYERHTSPTLEAMRQDLIVFRDVVSSEPATMASLMKMLTPADLNDPQAWNSKPDVLMLAREAGFRIHWLSNQPPNDGWLGLVSRRADEQVFINKGAGRGENNFDGNLLPALQSALQDPAPKKLIVVHLLGAHPTYDMRYPSQYAQFDSVRDGVMEKLENADRSPWIRQLRNEYDNAMAYNDYVVGNMLRLTMNTARQDNASLLLSSDHAQEVGHTRNHAGQSVADASGYEIPMLVWTRAFTGKSAQDKAQLEYRPYQTDQLEHTVMGLLGVQSRYYDARHDILSEQFAAAHFHQWRRINGQPYQPRTLLYNQGS